MTDKTTAVVGAANTTNMTKIAMTPTPENQAANVEANLNSIIRSGVTLESAPALDANVRSYYHRFPGAGTHLKDGTAIVFNAFRISHNELIGVFRTTDPAAIAHLDPLVDKPGTQIFSRPDMPEDVAAKRLAEVAADTKKNAGEL